LGAELSFIAIENNINQGRTAFVTAKIMALRGGMPGRVKGESLARLVSRA
jgi:hypothetical protein